VTATARGRAIRLFLVDDHALFRDGLIRLLANDQEFTLVGSQGSLAGALTEVPRHDIDVVLLDYMLGEEPAGVLVEQLRDAGFSGRILLVTAGLSDREARKMIRAGVSGIFHKQHAAEDLKRSIREVFEGKVLIDAPYLRQLVQPDSEDVPQVRLTERERLILRYLMEGLANKEMSARLGISESAVKAALQVLFNKTDVRTRSQLVRVALEQFRDEL